MNKKIIVSLLSCLLLSSCNQEIIETKDLKKLNEIKYPSKSKEYSFVDIYKINDIINFSFNTTKEIFELDNNNIYSPLSYYYALSMLTEGISNTNTLNKANAALGSDVKERRETLQKIYNNNYYENEYGKVYLANSFWSRFGLDIKQDYINNLTNYYYAEAFKANFCNNSTKKTIVSWINNNTENLLKLDINNYPIEDDLAALLINTLYFQGSWKKEFNKSDSYIDKFEVETNTLVDTTFMKHTYTGNYYDNEKFESVTDYFYDGYSIDYFLPKDGYSINDILNDKNIYSRENSCEKEITLSVPRFKNKSNFDLNEITKKIGFEDVYVSGNLGGINNDLFVSYVKQDAAIELDENGVKAAAVTSIGMKETAVYTQLEKITFTIDRPFIYIIYGAGKLPLFIGNVNDPTAK